MKELLDCSSIVGPKAIANLARKTAQAAVGECASLIGTFVKAGYQLGGWLGPQFAGLEKGWLPANNFCLVYWVLAAVTP